jgi:ankyrin repeat protein
VSQEQLKREEGTKTSSEITQQKEQVRKNLSMVPRTKNTPIDTILDGLHEVFGKFPDLFDKESENSAVSGSKESDSSPQKLLRFLVQASNPKQLNNLLNSLYEHRLLGLIHDYIFRDTTGGEKVQVVLDFYLEHFEDRELLCFGGALFHWIDQSDSQFVMTTLANCPQNDICRFVERIQTEKLKKESCKTLADFLISHTKDKASLTQSFGLLGFYRMAGKILPHLEMEHRLTILNYYYFGEAVVDEIILDTIVHKSDKNPDIEYLNALSRTLEKYKAHHKQKPGRSDWLLHYLVLHYSSNTWGEEARSIFRKILESPTSYIEYIKTIKSVSMLLALFEQFSLAERTIAEIPNLLKHHLTLLLKEMDADQAKRLLKLFIDNISLRPDLRILRDNSNQMTDQVIEGFAPSYTQLMLSSAKASSEVRFSRAYFLHLGGVMLEKMSAQDASALFNRVTMDDTETEYLFSFTNRDLFNALDVEMMFLSCRDGGKKLQDDVARELCSLFLAVKKASAREKSRFKGANIPQVYQYLGARLLPLMEENERNELLKDPDLRINESIVEALIPSDGPAPVKLDQASVRTLVLRSADASARSDKPLERSEEASSKAVAHCISVFDKQNNPDLIVKAFTVFTQDPIYGEQLQKILITGHLTKHLRTFIARINIKELMTLIEKAGQYSNVLPVVLIRLLGLVQKASDYQNVKNIAKAFALTVFSKLLSQADSVIFSNAIKADSSVSIFGLIVPFLLSDLFFQNSPEYPLFDAIIETMLSNNINSREVISLLKAALYDGDASGDKDPTGQPYRVRTDIIQTILTFSRLNEEHKKAIRDHDSTFLSLCVTSSGNARDGAIEAIKLFLDFGCTLKPKYINDDSTEYDNHNPVHLAAYISNVDMLRSLLPQVNRLSVVVLEQILRSENISLEAVQVVCEHAKAKNYRICEQARFERIFSLCSPVLGMKEIKTDIFIYLVGQGLKPTLERAKEAIRNIEKNEQKKQQLLNSLSAQFPDLAIEYAIRHNNLKQAEEIVKMNMNTGKFNLDQLRTLLENIAKNAADKSDSGTIQLTSILEKVQLMRTLGKAYLTACSGILSEPSELSDIERRYLCLDEILKIKGLLPRSCVPQIVAMIMQMIKQTQNGKADPKMDSFLENFDLTDLFVAKKYVNNRSIFSSGPKYTTSLSLAYLRLMDSNEQCFLQFMEKCYDTKNWPRDQATQNSYTQFMALVDELNIANSSLSKILLNEVSEDRLQKIKEYRASLSPR